MACGNSANRICWLHQQILLFKKWEFFFFLTFNPPPTSLIFFLWDRAILAKTQMLVPNNKVIVRIIFKLKLSYQCSLLILQTCSVSVVLSLDYNYHSLHIVDVRECIFLYLFKCTLDPEEGKYSCWANLLCCYKGSKLCSGGNFIGVTLEKGQNPLHDKILFIPSMFWTANVMNNWRLFARNWFSTRKTK